MVNKILNQFSTGLSVVLIRRIRHSCHITNQFFSIRSDVDEGGGVHTVVSVVMGFRRMERISTHKIQLVE